MVTGLVAFLFAIVIALMAVACVFSIDMRRNFPTEKYDERQQIDRGNAYRFSHWTGMVYYLGLLVYFVLHTGKSQWVIEPFVLLMIGILIQLQSFHIYCLMTHSALPLGEKPLPTICSYVILGGVYFLRYYFQYIPEDAAAAAGLTGAASHNLFTLLISLNFISLAVLHLLASLRKEKE